MVKKDKKQKVSTSFKYQGKDYKFSITSNCAVYLEDEFGMSFINVISRLGKSPSISTMRHLVKAALMGDHPDITVEECGEIMDHLGWNVRLEISRLFKKF